MANRDDLKASSPPSRWTKPDDYVASLARRRTARRARESSSRTQPEAPRFALSTLPFVALMVGLGILMVAIMIAAWPGTVAKPKAAIPQPKELGTAQKGWFQEAQREFRG
jgi:hypothetical protein